MLRTDYRIRSLAAGDRARCSLKGEGATKFLGEEPSLMDASPSSITGRIISCGAGKNEMANLATLTREFGEQPREGARDAKNSSRFLRLSAAIETAAH